MASGSLGGQSFTDATYEFDLLGDASNVVPGPNVSASYNLSAIFSVTGVGSGTMSNLMLFGCHVCGTGAAGIERNNNNGDLLDIFAGSGLGAYDLKTAFGPVSGGIYNAMNYTTSEGTLNFDDVSSITFEALTEETDPAPEPASLVLLATGLAGVGAVARKHRRA